MKPTIQEIQTRLKQVLMDGLSDPVDANQIGPETALVSEGLALDSVSLLELVVGIENEFDILLDDESLTVEHFESLAALATFIAAQLDEQLPGQQAA